jgi:hypothetical protein
MIWMPSYLAKNVGFSLKKSGMWTAVTVVGMACGIWAFGQLADRGGREANAGGLNELRRRSLVSVAAHEISIDEIGPHPGSFIARAFRRR